MKQLSIILNTALACTLIFMAISLGLPNYNARAAATTPTPEQAQPPQPTCNNSRTVQVSGTAVINVVPNRALVQLGIQSNGRSPKEVQAINTATINQITKALKSLGIDAKDIATDWYVVEPLYEEYASLRIKGYRIYNVVAITMRDVDKTSEAIALAFQAGANQVVNVEFYTSELRKYRDQARELAVKAAREKAELLADAAGAQTECVLNINENVWSYYTGSWWFGRDNNNLWTQNVMQNAAPAGNDGGALTEAGPVSLGQISVRAEVSTTFSLK